MSVLFILNNHVIPTAFASNAASESAVQTVQSAFPSDIADISLPAEFGKIQESFVGSSEEIAVLVQDAHAIPDAQRKIQRIIGHFQNQYGLRLVGLEGAASRLDPQVFKSFPDQELLKKTLDEYFDRGELIGSVAASILNEQDSLYYGIEDWEIYEQGLALFLSAIQKEAEVNARLGDLAQSLQVKKDATYSRDLSRVDKALSEFRSLSSSSNFIKPLRP